MELQSSVSQVEPADFPRVVEVWEASVRATHDFVRHEDIEFFRPMVRSVLPSFEKVACIRDVAGQVAGYIAVAEGKVEMLFVHPQARGQGVGRKLLTHAVEAYAAVTLDVNEQNDQAVGFYRRMGFEVVGRSELDSTGKPYPLLHMQLAART